jgi:hypothetical protein
MHLVSESTTCAAFSSDSCNASAARVIQTGTGLIHHVIVEPQRRTTHVRHYPLHPTLSNNRLEAGKLHHRS